MYYTATRGVSRSWRDHFRGLTQYIKHHNWLPMAVGTIITAWLALIISGLTQPTPTAPPAPVSQAANTNNSLNVGYKTDTPQDLTVRSTPTTASSNGWSNKSTNPQANTPTASATSASTSSAAVATVPTTTQDVTGGRGADTSTVTTPVTDTASITTPDSSSDGGLQVNLGLGDVGGVSVDVGGDNLLQADVDLLGL